MAGIFISYRRSDSAAITGRIFDRLSAHFGPGQVFMDIASIPIGHDFRDHVGKTLARCQVVLAVVGPDWAGKHGERRRIDDPADLVRLELEGGLARQIAVVPVLVEGATTPSSLDLPESLRVFSYRNAATVDSGKDFHPHVDRLIRDLEALIARGDGSAAEPELLPTRRQDRTAAPVPALAEERPVPSASSRSTLLHWALPVLVLGAIGVALLLPMMDNEPESVGGYAGIVVFELLMVASGVALARRWRKATGEPATAAAMANALFVLATALFTASVAMIPAFGSSESYGTSDGLSWAALALSAAGVVLLLTLFLRLRARTAR